MHILRSAAALPLAAAGLLGAAPAAAQALWEGFQAPRSEWSVFGGLTHSTNVTKSGFDERSDTIASLGASGALVRDTGRLQANVRASAWYENYLDDTFDDEVLGALSASLRYAIVPNRFFWTLEDTYGQVTANVFQPATPGNRVNANYLSTGPDLVLQFGPVTGLRLGGRYARSDFEGGQVDDERLSANVGVFRRLSGVTTVSLNAYGQRTEYRAPNTPQFEIYELFGRLESRRARWSMSLEGGATELRERSEKQQSPLVRVNLYRRMTPFWNLNLSAGTQYRNAGDILRDAIGDVRIVNNEVVYIPPGVDPSFVYAVIGDLTLIDRPLRQDYARGFLDYSRTRTQLGFSAGGTRERFQFAGQNLDRDVWDVGASLSRRLRPTVTGSASVGYYRREFVNLARSDDNLAANLSLSWQVWSQLAANVGYRYEDRSSDFAVFDYKDHIFYVGFTYGPPRRAAVTPLPGSTQPLPTTPTTVVPGVTR